MLDHKTVLNILLLFLPYNSTSLAKTILSCAFTRFNFAKILLIILAEFLSADLAKIKEAGMK